MEYIVTLEPSPDGEAVGVAVGDVVGLALGDADGLGEGVGFVDVMRKGRVV